eukprot:contig_13170_g3134
MASSANGMDAASAPAGGSPAAKSLVIATHDGTFHCDEALAVYMLRRIPRYAGASLTRTRNPEVLATADVVVDVGAEYDPTTHRYDHHQRGFDCTLTTPGKKWATKLSSAGLVYKHFGAEVIETIVADAGLPALSDADAAAVYAKVYESFVEAVDAVDNGIPQYVSAPCPTFGPSPAGAGGDGAAPPRTAAAVAVYQSSTGLSARVGRLNGRWNEDLSDGKDPLGGPTGRFLAASSVAGEEFAATVVDVVASWLPARAVVAAALGARFEADASGKVVVLSQFAPWKAHLFEAERAAGAEGEVLYVVYQDDRGSGAWRIQAVPPTPDSFDSRKKLPEAWRGVRDAELDKVSGVDGCIFVHASGFIGGNKTFEGVMAMAQKALVL